MFGIGPISGAPIASLPESEDGVSVAPSILTWGALQPTVEGQANLAVTDENWDALAATTEGDVSTGVAIITWDTLTVIPEVEALLTPNVLVWVDLAATTQGEVSVIASETWMTVPTSTEGDVSTGPAIITWDALPATPAFGKSTVIAVETWDTLATATRGEASVLTALGWATGPTPTEGDATLSPTSIDWTTVQPSIAFSSSLSVSTTPAILGWQTVQPTAQTKPVPIPHISTPIYGGGCENPVEILYADEQLRWAALQKPVPANDTKPEEAYVFRASGDLVFEFEDRDHRSMLKVAGDSLSRPSTGTVLIVLAIGIGVGWYLGTRKR